MKITILTCLTMAAFAANSVLTRLAIGGDHIDPAGFTVVRVAAGTFVLCALIFWRGGARPLFRRLRLSGAISLTAYMIGFSIAYLTLDAGVGALILFGVVQIAMFGYSILRGVSPTNRQVWGTIIAFCGLVLVLWPSTGAQSDKNGALLMVVAGFGWAAYTIIGRHSADPLATTCVNFLICLPIVLLLMVGMVTHLSLTGVALATICGGLTSGLGYALWYYVLPHLDGVTPAVVQLSVPILAILAGTLILREALDPKLGIAAVLVLGGIAWAISAGSVQADRNK